MKRITKLIISALFCGVILSSCNSNSELQGDDDFLKPFDITHDETASIIGEWSLEKIRVISRLGFFYTDCTPYNVTYEFKQNGALTVSSNSENHGWHESGEYSFIKDEWGMGHDGYPWGLKINNGSTYWYILSSKKLIIDYSPGDGATFYFVKN
jgi:hypothetical protein